MLLSYRWLSKILRNCPPPLALAEKLTMSGIEVENINDFGMISGKMVCARIEGVEKHPEAPKLAVCQVDAGAYGKLQVVCGAPNVRPGMIGVLAREGAEIAGGQTVKRTRIKGVASEGMLCSGAEIRWNSDHEGLLDLPEDSPVGEPVDCIFNIKITPNRPDLLSVFGVARDIAALEGRELYASQPRLREAMDAISGSVQVTVKDKRACPRYSCRLLRKCKVRKSPLWMRRALESMGLRSINNIVDATNYVLLEYGHPLHAFDLDKIVNKHIIVRMALEGESLTLLDGRKLILTPEDLVIGDQDRVIALAGVMGGANSEISEATINVLIESAYFEPITIRRTSQRHGLVTDSSYRFERGADYRQPPLSLNRATQLMAELTDAEVLKGVIDTGTSADQIEPITMNIPRACMILGCDLTPRSMADRLVHLGFETVRSDREQL
ncbi:MAG: phenylalanine--tRNA ligase subunit beta, partial [Candidatus Sumerlaeota bacterium]|nr:phenylalanine--tRNA ligase subunit beta [Candidatus Sumerlaeota bacterium]